MKFDVKIIGVGEVGINILEGLEKDKRSEIIKYSTIALSIDKKDLSISTIKKKILLGEKYCKGTSILEGYNDGKIALEEKIESITKAIGQTGAVILVADFGTPWIASATWELAKNLKTIPLPTECLIIKSFKNVGQEALSSYQKGILELRQESVNYSIFKVEEIEAFANSLNLSNAQITEILNYQAINKIKDFLNLKPI